MLWLWYNALASEWPIFFWAAVPVGLYTIAIRLALRKLTAGK